MLHKCFRELFFLACLLVIPSTMFAHPMGNFSVNHYSKITLEGDRVNLHYVIDLAEIPTFQALQDGGVTASGDVAAIRRYAAERGAELGRGLRLTLAGEPLTLHLKSSRIIFPPGAGGLPTMKMGFVYEALYPPTLDRTRAILHYVDANYEGRSGWKEIIATAPGGALSRSSVPATDRSAGLTDYPTDLLNSPPQDLEATVEAKLSLAAAAVLAQGPQKQSAVAAPQAILPLPRPATIQGSHPAPAVPLTEAARPGARRIPEPETPAPVLQANEQKTPRSRFTELITTQRLSPWFLFTAALIAMGLGALHALEPGHGKTIVAAYLVGSRGTARHAALLGVIVTLSHTAGVFALGAITLYASRYIVPEHLYPWLGVFSGITIAALGCYMFLRRLSGTATDHSHGESGLEGHFTFFKRRATEEAAAAQMEAGPAVLAAASNKRVSMTQLFTLGVTGGIIPCPAALIVLLSAFALHRIALGFFLILAFSVGLAAVLIAFGMLMVYARRFMSHLQEDGPITKRWLPLASSAFITVLGLGVMVQALAAAHFSTAAFSKERLGPVLFVIGLGLVLGMRHSTDADHVVAISTIVSKQRSIRGAAFIGSVWGLGHTITIFAVGALIILFGVQIPPRVGLSMEFCVALMLIVLGVLNLTGVMQKITTRLTPNSLRPGSTPEGTQRRRSYVPRAVTRFGLYQFIRPLVIGLVHGLAGSAAVALLVLSTIHDPVKATLYLLIFGLGTMIGMMFMTAAMAVPLAYAGDRFSQMSRYLGLASGAVSLCFGSFLVYQLGYVARLFTSNPQWTPR